MDLGGTGFVAMLASAASMTTQSIAVDMFTGPCQHFAFRQIGHVVVLGLGLST